MIELKVSFSDYQHSSKEEKSRIFNELANRILVVHPEYMEVARTTTMKELCQDIIKETQDKPLITKKEDRKIKRLIKNKIF